MSTLLAVSNTAKRRPSSREDVFGEKTRTARNVLIISMRIFLPGLVGWRLIRGITMRDKEKHRRRIFVVADTHDRMPELVKQMAKPADEIWHLGDVCAQTIFDELCAVGPPVKVVRGNCDSNLEWPLVLDLTRGELNFRLQHIPPDSPPDNLDVVLHGHTHVPRNEKRGRVLFLNPGCVTRPNRGAPPSVAWMEIKDGKVTWELVALRSNG